MKLHKAALLSAQIDSLFFFFGQTGIEFTLFLVFIFIAIARWVAIPSPFLSEVTVSTIAVAETAVGETAIAETAIAAVVVGLGLSLGLTLPDAVGQEGEGVDASATLGEVVGSSQLLGWGVVGGHSTVGVGHQGGGRDGETDSWDGKAIAIAQPGLSLSLALALAEAMAPGAVDAEGSVVGGGGGKAGVAVAQSVSEPWLGLSLGLTLPDAVGE